MKLKSILAPAFALAVSIAAFAGPATAQGGGPLVTGE